MTNSIIYSGANVTLSNQEILSAISFDELLGKIKSCNELKNEIDRLRKVYAVDKTAYNNVKKRLPYFCCASFSGNVRKSENFISIKHFVIDIDKIKNKEELEEIKSKLKNDLRLKMIFVSPSGHGLKAIYELSEPCTSLKQFSDFYKTFSHKLAEMMNLGNYIDFTTCDATRVCFFSHDSEAYFDFLNETIDINTYLPTDIFVEQKYNSDFERSFANSSTNVNADHLQPDIYKNIMQKLNPKAIVEKKPKNIFVPEILNTLLNPVIEQARILNISVKEIRDIHYGKKFVFAMNYKTAEVNLFHGSKGFSVIITPKNGTDPKLAEIGEAIIRKVLSKEYQEADIPKMLIQQISSN
jgi:translation elongation factor EF-1beta